MKEFWEQRYASEEFAYGTEPNLFFREWVDKLPVGSLYLPGEGEGRNAVYAAEKGWDVYAFDQSENARKKAIMLAAQKGVELHYLTGNIDDVTGGTEKYDLIALVFFHLLPNERKEYFKMLKQMLKPGGHMLIEAFSKEQLNYETGGPRNIEMLYDLDEIVEDMAGLEKIAANSGEVLLDEGRFHQGKAHIMRYVGKNSAT